MNCRNCGNPCHGEFCCLACVSRFSGASDLENRKREWMDRRMRESIREFQEYVRLDVENSTGE